LGNTEDINKFSNSLFDSISLILNPLSFYSPLIVCIGVFFFSVLTGTISKSFVFILWIFVITFIRIILFKGFNSNDNTVIPKACNVGLTSMFISQDVTYSTYILSFTMMYFITPMIMISRQHNINVINYGVLAFFIAYICEDLFIKNSLFCIPGVFSKLVIGNILAGLFLGALISGIIMYGTAGLKNYLFINEISNNKDVCTMPSKQQFKCRVFKDGTLVGNL